MAKETAPRIRVTLNLDARIYELTKRMSKIEEQPISRIVDEALFPIVKKYSFPTPEAWEGECRHVRLEEMEHKEFFNEPPEVDEKPDHEMETLMNKLYATTTHEEKLLVLEELKQLTELRRSKDEYRNRWIKHCSE